MANVDKFSLHFSSYLLQTFSQVHAHFRPGNQIVTIARLIVQLGHLANILLEVMVQRILMVHYTLMWNDQYVLHHQLQSMLVIFRHLYVHSQQHA